MRTPRPLPAGAFAFCASKAPSAAGLHEGLPQRSPNRRSFRVGLRSLGTRASRWTAMVRRVQDPAFFTKRSGDREFLLFRDARRRPATAQLPFEVGRLETPNARLCLALPISRSLCKKSGSTHGHPDAVNRLASRRALPSGATGDSASGLRLGSPEMCSIGRSRGGAVTRSGKS